MKLVAERTARDALERLVESWQLSVRQEMEFEEWKRAYSERDVVK